MNSFNHYSYGAIEEWMMAYCIGIERNEDYPGYKRFILQPRIGGTLSYAKGFFDSPYGRIESGWEKTPDGYVYSATVPANTSCELYLPGTEMISVEKGEDGIFPPEGPSGNSPKGYYRLSAGKYVFSVKM
jgi:alpha-L-rhamnosidase